jgi:hypothetical protein
MKTEIPEDSRTDRLARRQANRGRMGEAGMEYGGPVDRQTEVPDRQMSD